MKNYNKSDRCTNDFKITLKYRKLIKRNVASKTEMKPTSPPWYRLIRVGRPALYLRMQRDSSRINYAI